MVILTVWKDVNSEGLVSHFFSKYEIRVLVFLDVTEEDINIFGNCKTIQIFGWDHHLEALSTVVFDKTHLTITMFVVFDWFDINNSVGLVGW